MERVINVGLILAAAAVLWTIIGYLAGNYQLAAVGIWVGVAGLAMITTGMIIKSNRKWSEHDRL